MASDPKPPEPTLLDPTEAELKIAAQNVALTPHCSTCRKALRQALDAFEGKRC